MNPFKAVGAWLKKAGSLVWHALEAAGVKGLSDEVVALALIWVKDAARQGLDNDQKRAWVVQQLVNKRVPESIARLAVELAVQLAKKELAKV